VKNAEEDLTAALIIIEMLLQAGASSNKRD